MINPDWIRTTIASLILAILLRIGLGVPILTTFYVVGIIFLAHIVFTELGTGVKTALVWVKFAGNVLVGVVIFLALRFLAAKVISLYPVDTYGSVNASGGVKDILVGRDISKVILWEVMFALVAGGLSVTWTKGQNRGTVGGVFVVSLLILSFQVALPKYTNTFPSREEIDQKLAEKGLWGAIKPTPAPAAQIPTNAVAPPVQHPRSGSGYATQADPGRVWLNPRMAGIKSSMDARYCAEDHPDMCVVDRRGVVDMGVVKKWRTFPEGWYIITPVGDGGINYRWN